jgi:hypothetical protein
MILKAKKSFITEAGGQRHEVHEGDLISDSHPTALAERKHFVKASEDDVRKANERARSGA